ncbi:uncharacterized protein LOC125241358 isoform X1 [Leguminivora glycinivorella]|uniref:uncharacterized protein LOC125241358 isoform X1 n=1 Tax=Leguminivora glycinivorella TaxID=1035111 RepID=UPI00200DE893|nr:uncharacterized protein LOC125241358 isoform X1 [Leguminivora glycinivorella]
MSEIGWLSPQIADSSHSTFNRLEADSSQISSSVLSDVTHCSSYKSFTNHSVDRTIQCDLDIEFGKKFIMFDDDEMYEIRIARRRANGDVYEIGDVASSLNNTMHAVKKFSKITQYLIEKNEFNNTDWMDEILVLAEKLASKLNHRSGDAGHTWNNVNWGENVPYWNQYYTVMGEYTFPYEGRSKEDVILEVLSEEINKLFDKHVEGNKLGVPVEMLMDAVKHVTDDVEKVIMIMEDSGYELEGESVVYTGVEDLDPNYEEEFNSTVESDSVSDGSSSGLDFNGRLLNRTLARKIKMLRLMLPQEEDIKIALRHVVCRLKKIAASSGYKQGPARSRWLQSKLLELLTLTEKSILRRNLRQQKIVPLTSMSYDTGNEVNNQLSRIKAADDTARRLVEKYEAMLRLTAADNAGDANFEHGSEKSYHSKVTDCSKCPSIDLSKSCDDNESPNFPASETNDLSLTPNEDLTQYTLDEQHIDSLQDWEDKDMSLYQEETNEIKIRKYGDKMSPIQSKHKKSRKDKKGKAKNKSTKRKITNSSNSSICKKKSKQSSTLIAVKRSLVNTSSNKLLDKKNHSARSKPGKVVSKLTYNDTLSCIDKMRKKMGPTFVLAVPPKPVSFIPLSIPGSILELCHPHIQNKTADPYQKPTGSWDDTPPPAVAATENSQTVEILSQSETVMVALQRMIGTDPDVDAEIYEHELELSDLNSLLNDTSYFAYAERNSSNVAEYDSPGIGGVTQESSTNAQPEMDALPSVLKAPVVEIVTQDGQEFIALQRTIGTEPELDNEIYEQEIGQSRLTTSLNNMASFENFPVGVANATSQEFFLYETEGWSRVQLFLRERSTEPVQATARLREPRRL